MTSTGESGTLYRDGAKVLVYAYVIVITVQGKFISTVKDQMQKALNLINKWTDKE